MFQNQGDERSFLRLSDVPAHLAGWGITGPGGKPICMHSVYRWVRAKLLEARRVAGVLRTTPEALRQMIEEQSGRLPARGARAPKAKRPRTRRQAAQDDQRAAAENDAARW